MRKQDKLLLLLKKINSIFIQEQPHYYPGLLNGNAGIIQFLLNYYIYVEQNEATLDKISELFQKLLYQINTLPIDSSLGNGYSGIYWLMQNLIKENVLSVDSEFEVYKLLQPITRSISNDFDSNNFDFHYGFIGKYLLLDSSNLESYRQQLQSWIIKHSNSSNDILDLTKDKENEINLGLAHGLPSLLLFLRTQKLLPIQKSDYFVDILYSISQERLEENLLSIFPNSHNVNNLKNGNIETNSISRYAWCYGDLGILFAIASINDNSNRKLIKIKNDLLIKCNQRNLNNSMVNYFEKYKCYDPGFCHGIAGIYHTQKKINKLLKKKNAITTNEYWLKLLIQHTEQLIFQLPGKGFKNNNYEDMLNISTGIAGIGLVLISELTDNDKWDFCFMLNN